MSTIKWVIDPTHSEIGFKVKHMMFTTISGKFSKFDATIEAEDSNLENAKIEFTGAIESVATGNADRDTHLLSADFFDAPQFPEIKFSATSFIKINEGEYELVGDLTLHGVTKSVKLAAEYGGLMKDPWGNTKMALALEGKINRKDWGLNWNSALETGGVLVSEEVRLNIELQFLQQ
ncbi:YceI family protein [Flavobacterium sp. XS2P14]|uniref:YceI family protein n=1 Tax=unclassified Flavobacterium TaxID=196869 RepID=UPI003AB0D5A7